MVVDTPVFGLSLPSFGKIVHHFCDRKMMNFTIKRFRPNASLYTLSSRIKRLLCLGPDLSNASKTYLTNIKKRNFFFTVIKTSQLGIADVNVYNAKYFTYLYVCVLRIYIFIYLYVYIYISSRFVPFVFLALCGDLINLVSRDFL